MMHINTVLWWQTRGTADSAAGVAAPPTPVPVVSAFAYTAPARDEDAARFLLQAQFHVNDASNNALRSRGYAAWLSAQAAAPAALTGWDWMASRGGGSLDTTTVHYDNSYPGDHMVWHKLIMSSDRLRKRAALALSEFFVLSLSGLDFNWRSQAVATWCPPLRSTCTPPPWPSGSAWPTAK